MGLGFFTCTQHTFAYTCVMRFAFMSLLALGLTLVTACKTDEPSTPVDGGKFELKMTITPALPDNAQSAASVSSNIGWLINSAGGFSSKTSTSYDVKSADVVNMNIGFSTDEYMCREVKLEAILNGKVFKTGNFTMGMANPSVGCNHGTTANWAVAIP